MTTENQISVTEKAAQQLREFQKAEGKEDKALRVFVQGGGCSGFQYGLMIEEDEPTSNDEIFESNGIKVLVDPISKSYLKGAVVDFIENDTGGGFTIINPNATSTCGCGQSFNTD